MTDPQSFESEPDRERSVQNPQLRAFLNLSFPEIERRFEAGGVPAYKRYVGPTNGTWLLRDQQPWWAALIVRLTLDAPWSRWTGKGFLTPFDRDRQGAGSNLFANRIAPLRLQFRTKIGTADHDGQPCLTLEYRPGSLYFGLVDHVRELDDGLLLGQMRVGFPWRKRRIFIGYFALAAPPTE